MRACRAQSQATSLFKTRWTFPATSARAIVQSPSDRLLARSVCFLSNVPAPSARFHAIARMRSISVVQRTKTEARVAIGRNPSPHRVARRFLEKQIPVTDHELVFGNLGRVVVHRFECVTRDDGRHNFANRPLKLQKRLPAPSVVWLSQTSLPVEGRASTVGQGLEFPQATALPLQGQIRRC